MLEHLFDVSSCLCSHLNDNCSHVNSKAQPPHGLVVLILGKANKAYRMSELLLHQCCLQGVAASDGRGSAVKSTPKKQSFCFVNHCAALFVCLFVCSQSLSLFLPAPLSRWPLCYVSKISTARCCPPHPTEILPPSAHPPSPRPHYLSQTRVI